MSSRWGLRLLCVCGLTGAALACEDGATDEVVPIDRTGGANGAGGGATGGTGGGAWPTGGTTGTGGVCDADPEERCSVPIEICSGGFCEPVCVDYFYCLNDAVHWQSCLGEPLYSCPYGCEEMEIGGQHVVTDTEAEVCNPAPASGGTTGLGGAGD